MLPTRSMTTRRVGRLVAAGLVPVVLGTAACGGGSGDASTADGSDATAVTTAPTGDATDTTGVASSSDQTGASGDAGWCQVLGLIVDKMENKGEAAALTYPELVEKMQSVQPPAEAAAAWNSLEATLGQPGFDPFGSGAEELSGDMFTLAQVGMTHPECA